MESYDTLILTATGISEHCVPNDLLFGHLHNAYLTICVPDDLLFGQPDFCLLTPTNINVHCVHDKLLFVQPDFCPSIHAIFFHKYAHGGPRLKTHLKDFYTFLREV